MEFTNHELRFVLSFMDSFQRLFENGKSHESCDVVKTCPKTCESSAENDGILRIKADQTDLKRSMETNFSALSERMVS